VGKIAKLNADHTAPLPARQHKPGEIVHGLSRAINIGKIDGRTRLGQSVKALKRELRDYVGMPTIASELLIDVICYKVLRLYGYQRVMLMSPNAKEAHHYLPMANSLRLDLQALQSMAKAPAPPSLQAYIASKYGKEDK
jgi:hypothetical protein